MTNYSQWSDERLERAIKKFAQVVQDDIEHFLEAFQHDSALLKQMCTERIHRQANTSTQAVQPVTETIVS